MTLGVAPFPLPRHLLLEEPHVVQGCRVAAAVALLVAQPHVDPRHSVVLLVPVPAVVVPGACRCLGGCENLALRLPHARSGERLAILAYFPAIGSEIPTCRAIGAIGPPVPALLCMSKFGSEPRMSHAQTRKRGAIKYRRYWSHAKNGFPQPRRL